MPDIRQQLEQIHQQQRFRQRRVLTASGGACLKAADKNLLNFSSNDYLGLRRHPEVIAACVQAVEKYGVGSGASALISGYGPAHQQLEQELADFLGYDSVLLFSSGYLANQALISTLCQSGDVIYSDQLNHASIIDGCRLSRATVVTYPHSDMAQLEQLLSENTSGSQSQTYIISDGVFSMDGDIAACSRLRHLADQYRASLIIDDAHGVGVMGTAARGSWDTVDHQQKADILVGTLGKAFGVQGAYVAASNEEIELLVQRGRAYIYTTALAPAIAAAALASLKLIRAEPAFKAQLAANIKYFKTEVKHLSCDLISSDSPIQPLLLGTEERVMAWAEHLYTAGILVGAIRRPTIAAGTCRLRITLSAVQTQGDIDALLNALQECIKNEK